MKNKHFEIQEPGLKKETILFRLRHIQFVVHVMSQDAAYDGQTYNITYGSAHNVTHGGFLPLFHDGSDI